MADASLGPDLGAVILAAGAARRMGTAKQAIEIEGTAMVARLADAVLSSGASPVIVVTGAHEPRVREVLQGRKVRLVHNPLWEEGMASSIRAGIEALMGNENGPMGILVTPCDLPGLAVGVIRTLAERWRATGCTVCVRRGSRNGAPAVFARQDLGILGGLKGDSGARAFLNSGSDRVIGIEIPELGGDVDAPGDLSEWAIRKS